MRDQMFQNRWGMTANVATQRCFDVCMHAPHGDVTFRVKATGIDSVIDQVKTRRIPTPPEMTGFEVTEVDT